MLRDTLLVAFLFFITSIDSILLILSAIRKNSPRGKRKARLLVFCILCAAHPFYSFAVDSAARLPGLRLFSAILIIYFAFRFAGESAAPQSVRGKPKRTVLALIGTTIWLDAITSVDTVVLVSAASPSFLVTALGNILAMTALLVLAPMLHHRAGDAPWLYISVAAFMALSAVLQLRGEPVIGLYTAKLYLYPVGVFCLLLVGWYGWHRQLRCS
jgi:hypothetical protein